ncbi:MAG: Rrf2 family transcriptional regulator [Sideroxyarcus sp.]|nr:Rrf2 family transcriptional regulator [Sideroxyarcus sp.]
MKIDTKARIAISAILDVAIHGVSQPVRLADICARQDVSQSYLEQLFRRLVHGGFLTSVRGPGGGYRLSRRLAVVSVADIIGAVDTKGPGQKVRRATAKHAGDERVITTELWSGLDDYLHDYLRTVTLETVLAGAIAPADRRKRKFVVVKASQVPGDTRVMDKSPSSLWPLSAV